MHLLVGFYADFNSARTDEYIDCLRQNASNTPVTRITVFIEDESTIEMLRRTYPIFAHEKIRPIEHRRRLMYNDLFAYANNTLAGCAVIVANADIFFDDSLALVDDIPLCGRMLCLSRWDEDSDGRPVHFDRSDSQDAWIFEAPLPRIEAKFHLGVPGCDSRLAYETGKAGLILCNPSRSIRARHLHKSTVRRYTERDRLRGPLCFVPCSFLDSVPGRTFERPSEFDFPTHRGRNVERLIEKKCRKLEDLIERHLGIVPPRALWRELRRAAARCSDLPCPTESSLASVGFRETMGYSLSRLTLGASTHNNESRPLVFIPPELEGLQFTQVVANHSASVEIQFHTSGKLFVLASPGWEGYAPAADFLDDAGWREPIEALQSRDGRTFEVWSLVGTERARLIVPTQVILAGENLVRLAQ